MPCPTSHCRGYWSLVAAGLFLLPGLVSLSLVGCGHVEAPGDGAAAAPAPLAPKDVEVIIAARQAWPRTVTVQGALLADEDAVIGSKIAGRVATVQATFNRLVIYRASILHSPAIPRDAHYSADPRNGRLTLTSFLFALDR